MSRLGSGIRFFPYLFELSGQFTQYQLKQAAVQESLHSRRLLELFRNRCGGNDKDGWLSMPIEEFCMQWNPRKVTEKNFQLLRKRIIEPAVKELTEKTAG